MAWKTTGRQHHPDYFGASNPPGREAASASQSPCASCCTHPISGSARAPRGHFCYHPLSTWRTCDPRGCVPCAPGRGVHNLLVCAAAVSPVAVTYHRYPAEQRQASVLISIAAFPRGCTHLSYATFCLCFLGVSSWRRVTSTGENRSQFLTAMQKGPRVPTMKAKCQLGGVCLSF